MDIEATHFVGEEDGATDGTIDGISDGMMENVGLNDSDGAPEVVGTTDRDGASVETDGSSEGFCEGIIEGLSDKDGEDDGTVERIEVGDGTGKHPVQQSHIISSQSAFSDVTEDSGTGHKLSGISPVKSFW